MVYCGNNALSATLKANGGKDRFGTHNECLKKGYARGYNQRIVDAQAFLRKWSGRYKAHISQRLWHSDAPVPPGYQQATLSQTMQRWYGFGSMARARRLSQKQRTKSASPSRKPTLPLLGS